MGEISKSLHFLHRVLRDTSMYYRNILLNLHFDTDTLAISPTILEKCLTAIFQMWVKKGDLVLLSEGLKCQKGCVLGGREALKTNLAQRGSEGQEGLV